MTVRHRTVTDVLHEHLRLIGIEHDVLRGYRVVSQGDDVQYLQKWTSDRLYELRALLLKKECRECRSFFKGVLVFSSMCIEKMDELLVKLTQLHRLVLNDNRLKQIDCIPPELTELYACGNRITDLCATPVLASSSLVTLDLSYNAIKTIGPSALLHNVQNLNLAFNNITDLGSTISTIAAMPRLRSLRLDHNPISILFAYRQRILRAAAALETLDLVPIRPEARNQSSREPPPTPCDLTDVVLLSIRITSATHAPPELPVEDTARPNGFEERVLYHCEIRFPGQDTAMSVTNDVEADPETGTIMFNAVHEIQFRPSETWRDYLMLLGLRVCLYRRTVTTYQASETPEDESTWRQVRYEHEQLVGCVRMDTRHVFRCDPSSVFVSLLQGDASCPLQNVSEGDDPRTKWAVGLGDRTTSSLTIALAINGSLASPPSQPEEP